MTVQRKTMALTMDMLCNIGYEWYHVTQHIRQIPTVY